MAEMECRKTIAQFLVEWPQQKAKLKAVQASASRLFEDAKFDADHIEPSPAWKSWQWQWQSYFFRYGANIFALAVLVVSLIVMLSNFQGLSTIKVGDDAFS